MLAQLFNLNFECKFIHRCLQNWLFDVQLFLHEFEAKMAGEQQNKPFQLVRN